MTKKPIEPFPEKDVRDIGYRTARATLASVPILGPGLQEVVDAAIGLPLEKRREKWFRELGEAINEVCDRMEDLSPSKLGENDEFVTVVTIATQIAIRNHSNE